tara:strand:+ start:204 stop:392 length:189 start_codon:yes stop_codon:yes gene_type:complete
MNLENLTPSELELLSKMNKRSLKLYQIEEFFRAKKIQIDTKYLDSLTDEKIEEIYKTHCNGK